MAESVDALVSNTSGATHPGSIPGLGTKRNRDVPLFFVLCHMLFINAQFVIGVGTRSAPTNIVACAPLQLEFRNFP